MSTRATRDGDHYVLNGRKVWITNAGVSDFYTVFAKTDPAAKHRGMSVFMVEKGSPGFSVGKIENKMGVRGSPTGELIFDDVAVPAANLVGEEGAGFGYAMGALDGSRPIVGAQAVGIAQGALDAAVRYATERSQFGSLVANFQGIQFMLAEMATKLEAARLLVYRACSLLDAGGPGTSKASAMAKWFASDTAMQVTTDAVQVLGGVGYVRDFPVERMMRDAKATQLYEGTNQVQRIVIARRLLEEITGTP
jgi:alkylation response protein AidB-like acyl-CoA dehydrogenase